MVEHIQHLNACLSQQNLERLANVFKRTDLAERDLVVAVGVHLVMKLTGSAFTKEETASRECPCGCKEKLDTAPLFIGSEEVWHGELDLVSGKKDTNIVIGTDYDETGGDCLTLHPESCSNLEEKKDLKLCQILGESIVFAYTVCNRQKGLSALIPSILVTNKGFTVSVYNPKTDEMYQCEGFVPIIFQNENLNLATRYCPVFLLWIFFNHRIFFLQEMENRSFMSSGFLESLDRKAKKCYESLVEFRRHTVKRKHEVLVLNRDTKGFDFSEKKMPRLWSVSTS